MYLLPYPPFLSTTDMELSLTTVVSSGFGLSRVKHQEYRCSAIRRVPVRQPTALAASILSINAWLSAPGRSRDISALGYIRTLLCIRTSNGCSTSLVYEECISTYHSIGPRCKYLKRRVTALEPRATSVFELGSPGAGSHVFPFSLVRRCLLSATHFAGVTVTSTVCYRIPCCLLLISPQRL